MAGKGKTRTGNHEKPESKKQKPPGRTPIHATSRGAFFVRKYLKPRYRMGRRKGERTGWRFKLNFNSPKCHKKGRPAKYEGRRRTVAWPSAESKTRHLANHSFNEKITRLRKEEKAQRDRLSFFLRRSMKRLRKRSPSIKRRFINNTTGNKSLGKKERKSGGGPQY